MIKPTIKQVIFVFIAIIFIIAILAFINVDISKKLPWSGVILSAIVAISALINKYKSRRE